MNENNWSWGTIVVKSNFFLLFFGRIEDMYQKDILKLTDLYITVDLFYFLLLLSAYFGLSSTYDHISSAQ